MEMLGYRSVPGVGPVKLRDVLVACKIIKWALYENPLALHLKLGNSQTCICGKRSFNKFTYLGFYCNPDKK